MSFSVKILGFFVRGFFEDSSLNKLRTEESEFIKQEIKKWDRSEIWVNITALILIIGYPYLLFHFFNIGIMLMAIIWMIIRLPDLLWEIKNSKKNTWSLTRNEAHMFYSTMPHYILISILQLIFFLISLPLLYYFLYCF